ncbi:unnamed protein product [Amoebophrya sp. A120]|nr:unnamed protein product [Amoebophrya sp. A120]|eukprot:GSA120T00020184001.1
MAEVTVPVSNPPVPLRARSPATAAPGKRQRSEDGEDTEAKRPRPGLEERLLPGGSGFLLLPVGFTVRSTLEGLEGPQEFILRDAGADSLRAKCCSVVYLSTPATKLLGRGAFGCVYLATSKTTGKLCALKVARSGRPRDKAKQEQEAALLNTLRAKALADPLASGRDPAAPSSTCVALPQAPCAFFAGHLCTPYEIGVLDLRQALDCYRREVCGKVPAPRSLDERIGVAKKWGGSLFASRRPSNPHTAHWQSHGLSWDVAQVLARHIFRGLAWVHSHGFAHMDLKPENMLLYTDETRPTPDSARSLLSSPAQGLSLKLSDLGEMSPTSEVHPQKGAADPPARRTQRMTWTHRAPEFFLGCPEPSESADIWSAGQLVYELIAGVEMFRDDFVFEGMRPAPAPLGQALREIDCCVDPSPPVAAMHLARMQAELGPLPVEMVRDARRDFPKHAGTYYGAGGPAVFRVPGGERGPVGGRLYGSGAAFPFSKLQQIAGVRQAFRMFSNLVIPAARPGTLAAVSKTPGALSFSGASAATACTLSDGWDSATRSPGFDVSVGSDFLQHAWSEEVARRADAAETLVRSCLELIPGQRPTALAVLQESHFFELSGNIGSSRSGNSKSQPAQTPRATSTAGP